jgi:hypothetical protein
MVTRLVWQTSTISTIASAIGVDNLGMPAVAIMSNKIIEQQVAKVERSAKTLAGGKARHNLNVLLKFLGRPVDA